MIMEMYKAGEVTIRARKGRGLVLHRDQIGYRRDTNRTETGMPRLALQVS